MSDPENHCIESFDTASLHQFAAKGDYNRVKGILEGGDTGTAMDGAPKSLAMLRRAKSLSSLRERSSRLLELRQQHDSSEENLDGSSFLLTSRFGVEDPDEHQEHLVALVNEPNRHGITPLQAATYHGRHRIVRLLLDHGARPSQPSQSLLYWTTPLHLAACQGHLRILMDLLEAGADPYLRDYRAWTPVEVARVAGNRRAHRILADWIREREEAGSVAEEVNIDGRNRAGTRSRRKWRTVRVRASRKAHATTTTTTTSYTVGINDHYSDDGGGEGRKDDQKPKALSPLYHKEAAALSTPSLPQEWRRALARVCKHTLGDDCRATASTHEEECLDDGTIYIPPGPWDIDLMQDEQEKAEETVETFLHGQDSPQEPPRNRAQGHGSGDLSRSNSTISRFNNDEPVDYLPSILEEGQQEETESILNRTTEQDKASMTS